jgi:phenylacetate-CoA ligase
MRNQSLPPEDIEQISWAATRQLLQYAYAHVPYYRQRFDSVGLRPEDITTPDQYVQVPPLTREDVASHFRSLLADETSLSDVRISSTGGSTGQPVRVYLPKRAPRAALGWRMLSWWGLPPDCDWARAYRDTRQDVRAKVLQWITTWPTREIFLNASAFGPREFQRFVVQFNHVRPPLLQGYVGAMDALANYILDRALEVHSPKAVWVTSAPITAVQESRIEEAFHAPVYDQYGCCEVHWLAAQCSCRQGMHMFHDARRIEFLDEDYRPQPPGVYGNVAVTDLMNFSFPLIRYLTGDRGRALARRCECGCNLPLMDKVKGRVSETFKLPSGTCINGEFLTTLFDHQPDAVRQFRVHQNRDRSIEVLVVPSPQFRQVDQVLEEVIRKLTVSIRAEVPIRLRKVDSLPQRGGKLQFITSDVK